MTSIYTTKSNLERILLSNDKNIKPWFNILEKLKEVYINDTYFIEPNVNPEDNLFLIVDAMQIDIKSDTYYINDIPSHPIRVLEHPSSIFLLDIPSENAQQIQNNYGVICQSNKQLDHRPLTMPHKSNELQEGETDKNWNKIIGKSYLGLPSNYVLIVDRHLFDNDRYNERNDCYDEQSRVGLENLFEILNCLLPTSFQECYHIGILTTDMDVERKGEEKFSNLKNIHIAKAVDELRERLNRPYPLNIEILYFNPGDQKGYKLIHNRRIISNYMYIKADYLLAALKKGTSRTGQTIDVSSIFENIDRDPHSDKKVKTIKYDHAQFKSFIDDQAKARSQTVTLWQNNVKINDCTKKIHRFFN